MLRILLIACCLLLSLPNLSLASSRYFVSGYTFSDAGQLKTPLSVEMVSGYRPDIKFQMKTLPVDNLKSFVMAFIKPDGSIFLHQFFGSTQYIVYKTKLPNSDYESLVFLGLKDVGSSKYILNEMQIIGGNRFGDVQSFKLVGFEPTEILKMPLQLNAQREIVMPISGGGSNIVISWDAAKGSFTFKK